MKSGGQRQKAWVLPLFGGAALFTVGVYWEPDIRSHLAKGEVGSAANAAITTASQYERMAVRNGSGRVLNMPQLLFIIDRTQLPSQGGRLYWIDSKRFPFHYDFVRSSYLSTVDLTEFNDVNYRRPDRRFIIGSIVHYPNLQRYGVEMWEGDTIDLPMLQAAMKTLQARFFTDLSFKPNSDQQEALVRGSPGFPVITPQAAYGSQDMLTLNTGTAVGRLRLVDDAAEDVGRGDIVILRSNPLTIAPVAGIVTTHFSTPLSHVNLLAGTWDVPNAYLRNADDRYADLAGKIVVMKATAQQVSIREATPAEAEAAQHARHTRAPRVPRTDLAYTALPSLAQQTAADVVRTGAKSANLGEVFRRAAMTPDAGFAVPPGFTIPFHYYDAFVRSNGIEKQIEALLSNRKLAADRDLRHRQLASLRKAFLKGRLDPRMMDLVQARRGQIIGTGGVFARSSTNSEDLQGFNGAGLYTSVPNVQGREELADAIRTVWSSVWNDRAYEAREAAGIDHRGVRAAVLIQLGMNSESSGVMVTGNPFAPEEQGSVFVNAKRGLGMRVVEGRKVAEQLIYHGDMQSIQVLTRSTDDVMLTFDKKGGVRPVSIDPHRAILTDHLTRRLVHAGLLVQDWFGGTPQDIEWLTVGDQLYIVQARPWHPNRR